MAAKKFGKAAPLLLVGLLFHATYLASIFDIFFVSPVVRVDQRFSALDALEGEATASETTRTPLADRLVLIVGDGLRADKLFGLFPSPPFATPLPPPVLPSSPQPPLPTRQDGRTTPAPYLRSLIESGRASWGVSHTRVPTESRPGHVALIAGMYEDVSAVTKGWKMNPVDFDSLFNRSEHTFSFGSPDILPMFKHGAEPRDKVDAWSYEESAEDFTKDAAQLDVWALDRLKALFEEARHSAILTKTLKSRKVVFFLHLLGLDTTGHAYRPHSPEYYRNIQVVDSIVRSTERLMRDFYADDRTAYVFTADHGMSNIGNHGDGDPHNTRTPLVVWGSGVKGAARNGGGRPRTEEKEDPYFAGWALDAWERNDVEQADVAALMASLIGVGVPGNSVGRLPTAYLDASPEEKARAGLAVAREVLEQYQVKHDLRASRAIYFRPFPKLPDVGTATHQDANGRVTSITNQIKQGRFEEALQAEDELAVLALEGLKYLQRYDWLLLQSIVVVGYLGWMAYATRFVLTSFGSSSPPPASSSRRTVAPAACWVVFSLLAGRFAIEKSPFTYYLYALFPAYFWSSILSNLAPYAHALRSLRASASPLAIVLSLVAVAASLEGMVLGYFDRRVWSVGWLVLGWLWPVAGMSAEFRKGETGLIWAWRITTVGAMGFTLLPVEKGESLLLIALGAIAFFAAGLSYRQATSRLTPSILQLGILMTTLHVTLGSARRLQRKQGLPLLSRGNGWLLLFLATATAKARAGEVGVEEGIAGIVMAFAPVFVLLSISYETLFYFVFSAALMLWLELEARLARYDSRLRSTNGSSAVDKPKEELRAGHVRLALFFLFYIHVGFFGTGNVASISSFYLEPVYRLVPVFNPFLMASLLIYKILIPFLVVSAVLAALNLHLRLPPFALFVTTLAVSDVLTLNFFFLVTDEGSWLQIGQSISHFCIASLLLVFVILLNWIGELLVGSSKVKQM